MTGTGDGDLDVGETITVTGNTCGVGTTAIGASYVVTGFSGGGMPVYRYETNGAGAWVVAVISEANNQAPTLSVRTICLNT